MFENRLSEAALSDLPYIDFLAAHPHPAIILPAVAARRKASPALHPVYANPSFCYLLHGEDAPQESTLPGYGFVRAIRKPSQVQALGEWLQGDTPDFVLEVDGYVGVIELHLTKTRMEEFWVCTSIPKFTVPSKLIKRPLRLRLKSPGRIPDFFDDVSRSPPTIVQIPEMPQGPGSIEELMRTFDWENSPLGPRDGWPQSLKSALSACMSAPFPSAIWWGPEAILLYNDAYIMTAGSKHPRIWGCSGSVAWAELWEEIGPVIRDVFNGNSIWKRSDLLLFERLTEANLPEENYYDWSYRPIRQEDGTVGGFINDCFDVTDKVIAERRMNCLRDLIAATILSSSLREFCDSAIHALSKEVYSLDIPFAALYTCSPDPATLPLTEVISPVSPTAITIPICLDLVGKIGIPDGHSSIPDVVKLEVDFTEEPQHASMGATGIFEALRTLTPPLRHLTRRQSSSHAESPSTVTFEPSSIETTTRGGQNRLSHIMWPFVSAIKSRRPTHISQLPDYVVEGFHKRGWGDRVRGAVVIPIGLDDQLVPNGILLLGLNTRRPYDRTTEADMDIIRMTLSSTLKATLSREADAKRAEQLAELDAAKTSFFSNVSHELRTPLTLIKGPVEDSISHIPEGQVRNNLKMAQRNINRLARLVDSLMDFSKLAANRLEGQFRPVKLGIFTADLASLFRNPVEKSGLEYNVSCDQRSSQPTCYIDPDFWEKIVFNIVGNAFKYTLSGSIEVSVEYTSTHVIFAVRDTGTGIPKEDLNKIFDRFHRVEERLQGTGRSHEGTGIGLALTKELVTLHGAELAVESNDDPEGDHGTKFTVTMPIGKAHLPKANISEFIAGAPQQGAYARGFLEEASLWNNSASSSSGERTPSEAESGSSGESGRLDPSTMFFVKTDVVLLVDDNADMRRYVSTVLSRYCTVIQANNGHEALQIARTTKPNLVLSDVMMPVMDGHTLLKELRDDPELNLVPVILLTARSGEDSQVEGLLSGADDYLAKPFKSAELIARVHLQMQLGKKRVDLETRFKERTLEIQQLSELSPVAIFRADHKGRISYVNARWYDITGLVRQADINAWPERIHEEDRDMVLDWWLEINEQGVTATDEERTVEFRWDNGSWCQAQCATIDGRGILGAFTDISQQKKLEAIQLAHALEKETVARKRAEEAEEQRKAAEERRRGQELLIDVTSHELRQPVSAILNCSSLVRTNLSALRDQFAVNKYLQATEDLLHTIDEDLGALDAIYQCGLAQERIANDVLSLSRMQLNVLSIYPVNFDLVKEVQRISTLFHNEVQMKRINLTVTFGESLTELGVVNVSSDKARFAQILTNLLSNAIKFTDTSTHRRDILAKVDVSLDPPADESCSPPEMPDSVNAAPPGTPIYIYVSVTDSGPGVRQEDLVLLFNRFQQGSNSHDVFGGSGLGLFVSRQLCNLMGGRIEVSSTYGEGATFRFFIQSKTASSPNSSPRSAPGSLVVSGLSTPANQILAETTAQPLHILITEDNLINQTILNRQLKKAGFTTVLANNGQQALDQIRTTNKPFDAILMDVEMPVLDGLSAVREIRKMEASGELPHRNRVFALTGNARQGQVKNIREAGMDDVMIKPYRIDEVIAKLLSTETEPEE